MFGWREAVVCLVIVGEVCGSLEEDLTKFKAVMDQTKTVDFLNGLAKHYSSYLRLCKAQINVSRENQKLSSSLETGIAALNTKMEFLTPNFKPLVEELEITNRKLKSFKPYTGLLQLQQCEKIRSEYINSVGTANIEAIQKEYLQNCKYNVIDPIHDFLSNSWIRIDRGKTSFIQRFRQLVYDHPKMMDSFVCDWIKYLIRSEVVTVTTYLLDPQFAITENDRKIKTDHWIKFYHKFYASKVVKNAKLILKSVEDSRMFQVKKDLIRYLKREKNTACDKSSDLLAYLKTKYDKTDIAVIVFKGNRHFVKVCNGAYVFNIDHWNGFVAMRPAATSYSDANKIKKLKWMDGILDRIGHRSFFNTTELMSEQLVISEQVLSPVLPEVGQGCKKMLLASIIHEDLPQCLKTSGFAVQPTVRTGRSRSNYTIYLVD